MAEAGNCSSDAIKIGGVRVLVFEWESDGSGNVSEVGILTKITGVILGVWFKPSTTDQPSNEYDVELLNADGYDVLLGVGANLPNDPADSVCKRTPLTADDQLVPLYDDTLALSISGAGASKKGTVHVFLND